MRKNVVLLFTVLLFAFNFPSHLKAQVLLDAHVNALGATTWTITTTHPNEIILLSAGGYGVSGRQFNCGPGNVKVNGNNATYLTKGEWLNFNFTWTCSIWAYVAPVAGSYSCSCTENGMISPFYFNYATSVYQPNCPQPLSLHDIVLGGVDSNRFVTTISASITTTENNSFVYGVINNNDNGGTGTVAWVGITELDHNYINNGIDGSQAGSTIATAGSYTITSTDLGASNVWMTIALVAVQPDQNCCTLDITANTTNNINCFGGSNGSATVVADSGHSPYTYLWTPGGQTTTSITGLTAGTYTITVKDTSHCTKTATVTITQPTLLTSTTTVSNVLCFGGNSGNSTVTPGGGTSPYTYSWTPGGQTNATASNLTVGSYSVIVSDNNGCTASASATLTQPVAPLEVSLAGPQVICAGQSGILTAFATGGTTSYNYNWSCGATTSAATVFPNANTTYTCTITDVNGCTVTASIAVNLGPRLYGSITAPRTSCAGNPVNLCGHASGGTGGFTFNWQPGNLAGRCITVYPASTTIYTLTVGDNCGGDTMITATVLVNPLPLVSFQTDLQQGCSPLCIRFNDLSSVIGGNDIEWLWNFGNGDSSNMENPLYCYANPGTFALNLTVTSDSGCSSSLNLGDYISVYSHPVANFTASPQPTTILNPDIQFKDKTTDQYGLVYWFWNFGDKAPQPKKEGPGGTSNLENPSHTYSDTGTYCVRMVAMNLHGCTDTITNCLDISPIFNFYIPSAFSPNGDGVNDVFIPKGSYITKFEMYIFDRWGNQLFHSTDINNGWTGTVNGGSTIVQEDTYVYLITVFDSKNAKHTYTGMVNLIK